MTTPFDPKAASLYGQFVQAAYSMHPAGSNNLQPKPANDFPAGFHLVAWIQMDDFLLASTGPQFYGFVAQSAQDAGQFIVALRGTSSVEEWWDDLNALRLTPFKVPNCGSVGDVFARIYDTLQVIECPAAGAAAAQAPRLAPPAGSFAQQVSALVRRRQPQGAVRPMGGNPFAPTASVEITGHSLGAALATLYAMENGRTGQIASPMLCTFASPLVGDATFAAAFNALNLDLVASGQRARLGDQASAGGIRLRSREHGGAGQFRTNGLAESRLLAFARNISELARSHASGRTPHAGFRFHWRRGQRQWPNRSRVRSRARPLPFSNRSRSIFIRAMMLRTRPDHLAALHASKRAESRSSCTKPPRA